MLFFFEHSNAQLPAGLYANNVSLPAGQHFSALHLYDKKNWNAEWIWLNQNLFQDYQRTQTEWIHPFAKKQAPYRALFRKQFTIDKLPEKAVLFISADVRYEVYITIHLLVKVRLILAVIMEIQQSLLIGIMVPLMFVNIAEGASIRLQLLCMAGGWKSQRLLLLTVD